MKIVTTQRKKILKEKASSIVLWLILILLFKFGNTLVSFRVFSENSAWIAFNISQFLESIVLPFVSIQLCKPKYTTVRALLLTILLYNSFGFFEYCLLVFNPKLFFITSTTFICFIIPFLYRYLSESMRMKSDQYMYPDSFLVYKSPSNLSGSMCALITAPYGHCSLVTYGREFIYKKGVLIEREFTNSNILTFKKIPRVELLDIRKIVGKKWSVFNNCFRTFKKFRKFN